jgi:hypothetical protein
MSKTDKAPEPMQSGLQTSGEFNIGDKITFGIRNGNVLLRRKPQGDEVEIGEGELAGALIDVFFTDKRKTLSAKT